MRHVLTLLFCSLCIAYCTQAQILDVGAIDSFTIRFTTTPGHLYRADTSLSPLWQIGKTHKSFFTADTSGITAIMTDTLSAYPTNADNSFVIAVPKGDHTLIQFWHRYETCTHLDGGFVEYSQDGGVTWDNVSDSCNADSTFSGGLLTYGFYGPNDTLPTGIAAFSGNSGGSKLSMIQFMDPPAPKGTSSFSCVWAGVDTFYVRFRFVSDSVTDTMAGWMIDSLRVKHFLRAPGLVLNENVNVSFSPSPNPSRSGLFYFPAVGNFEKAIVQIVDVSGRTLFTGPNKGTVQLTDLPHGVYFYRVMTNQQVYSGKLFYE
ncbi:MAG: T9SS type A sorting domain-containing protein [Chitinophagaceae bacterium]|nr:T9SS type A sorting domain-containing protein [Chitinophagaceae bacterium]